MHLLMVSLEQKPGQVSLVSALTPQGRTPGAPGDGLTPSCCAPPASHSSPSPPHVPIYLS